jgi:hypothetical protein
MATGVIHDLGYKRYVGTRRPQSTRWRVITRNLLSFAWKRWWRYKAWLGIAFIVTVVLSAVMILSREALPEEVGRSGVVVRLVDGLVFGSSRFYSKIAFLLSLTVGIGVVAADMRSGAFTFYFSRPVRPVDYIVGKLVGLTLVQASVLLVPMLLLSFVRLGISKDTDELIRNLAFVPKAALIGGVASLTYASVSLGFSAAMANTKLNLALWAAYYLIITSIIGLIGATSDIQWLASVDIGLALSQLSAGLFGLQPFGQEVDPLVVTPLVSLLGYSVAGIAFAYYRVGEGAHAGIGGGS